MVRGDAGAADMDVVTCAAPGEGDGWVRDRASEAVRLRPTTRWARAPAVRLQAVGWGLRGPART